MGHRMQHSRRDAAENRIILSRHDLRAQQGHRLIICSDQTIQCLVKYLLDMAVQRRTSLLYRPTAVHMFDCRLNPHRLRLRNSLRR